MNLLENLQTLHESEREEIFSFKWEKGSVNDNIKKCLNKKNIQWRYNGFFELEAFIKGRWVRFDYEKDSDDITHIYIK